VEAAADGEEAEVDCVEAEVDCVSGFGKLPRLKENIKSTERSRWALWFSFIILLFNHTARVSTDCVRRALIINLGSVGLFVSSADFFF